MPTTSVKLRMEGDNTSWMRAVNQGDAAVKQMGENVQKYLGDKLRNMITPTAIVEAVRRTGEWATELKQTSTELGMTTKELQALQTAAKRAFVNEGGILSFYSRLNSAAKEAIRGNVDLRASFSKLGITSDMLRGATGPQLFGKALGGFAGGNASIQNLTALRMISGQSNIDPLVQFARSMGAGGLSGFATQNQELIMPEEDIDEFATVFKDVMEDLKQLFIDVAPIVKVLAKIVGGISSMVVGLADMILSGIEGIKLYGKWIKSTILHPLKSHEEERKAIDEWAVKEFEKTEYRKKGLIEAATFGMKSYTPKDYIKMSDREKRTAVGGGEALFQAATFGVGGGAKALSKATGISAEMGPLMKRGLSGQFEGVITALSNSSPEIKAALYRRYPSLNTIPHSQWGSAEFAMIDEFFSDPKNMKLFAKGHDAFNTIRNRLKYGTRAAEVYSMARAGQSATQNALPDVRSPIDRLREIGAGMFATPIGAGGATGGGPNLRIGGVLGVDVSLKIVTLNEKMLVALNQIVLNTNASTNVSNTLLGNP